MYLEHVAAITKRQQRQQVKFFRERKSEREREGGNVPSRSVIQGKLITISSESMKNIQGRQVDDSKDVRGE